jgi:predicted HD phosphohydrolase
MKLILHKLKRLIQKYYISLSRFTTPTIQKSKYEKDCIAICRKLISKEDTILLLTPISKKRYIRNENHQIFVILEGHSVKIINHVYSYTVFLEETEWNNIINTFDNEVEKRREDFEKEIVSNIKHSLQNILQNIL